ASPVPKQPARHTAKWAACTETGRDSSFGTGLIRRWARGGPGFRRARPRLERRPELLADGLREEPVRCLLDHLTVLADHGVSVARLPEGLGQQEAQLHLVGRARHRVAQVPEGGLGPPLLE